MFCNIIFAALTKLLGVKSRIATQRALTILHECQIRQFDRIPELKCDRIF
ncbi:MAG: hypothetical protein KME38_02540 [Spirirestis rafaelensis WJT71-NPBG6]|nr:hypothetical protein [Spirirestis rafaelensis WJT71-NPBG6]